LEYSVSSAPIPEFNPSVFSVWIIAAGLVIMSFLVYRTHAKKRIPQMQFQFLRSQQIKKSQKTQVVATIFEHDKITLNNV
jgi:hypothetical protein